MSTHTIKKNACVVSMAETQHRQRAWEIAAAVPDPEIPSLTIEDLGILRRIEITSNGVVVAHISPTYSACPAVMAIEEAVEQALTAAGYRTEIKRVISPAWTTDWITDMGRKKLKDYGIAPPDKASPSARALFSDPVVACPRCDSTRTEKVSEFGSTACKAHYKCEACNEPFDYFKCL